MDSKGKEFGRIVDPDAVVAPDMFARDAQTGVQVAVGRRDYGADAALRGQFVTDRRTGKRRLMPPKRVIEILSSEVDGQQVDVSTVVTTLRGMYRKGTITQEMYDVGCEFKRNFDIARLDGMRVPAIDRSPSAGGFRSTDEPVRIMVAKDAVWSYMQIVGGASTGMGIALWNVVGLEVGFALVAAKHGGNRNHWSGALVNALDLIAAKVRRGEKVS